MKPINILGLLITFLMMMGMRAPIVQTCCGWNETTSCLLFCLQPPIDGSELEIDTKRESDRARMRPERQKPKGVGIKPFKSDRQLPENMVEHIMEVAKEIDPELATQLMSMCEKDPKAFNKIVRKQGRRLGSLIRLRDADPELFEVKVTELKIDAEIYHVAEDIRGKDRTSSMIQAHIAELEGLVRVRTALSIRAQTLYIERLEKHLLGLRTRLEDTTEKFDEIVGDRVGQLLNVVDSEPQMEPKSIPMHID